MPSAPSLRDRKRARTRQALIDAAVDLFDRNGYEATTVADIAAAADIGTRTFFSYFASKEELLFPESDERVQAAVTAIADRGPDDGPADVLMRALRDVGAADGEPDDMVERLAALRLRLFESVPAVRGRALQIQLDAQQQIARHLHAAYPEDLDEVAAAALVGAFIGAVSGALQVLLAGADQHDRQELRARLQRAVQAAIDPWQNQVSRR